MMVAIFWCFAASFFQLVMFAHAHEPRSHVCRMLLCKSSWQQFGTQLFQETYQCTNMCMYIDISRQVAGTCWYTIRNLWLFRCHGASLPNFSFEPVGLPCGLWVSPALSCVCRNELATWLRGVMNFNPELTAMNLEVHIGVLW